MVEGLKNIFGNETAERVLLHILVFEKVNASAIATHYKTAIDPIIRQLERFQKAGVLKREESYGRTKLYSFDDTGRYTPAVRLLVEAYKSSLAPSKIPSNKEKKGKG
jgi:hypothetical protein